MIVTEADGAATGAPLSNQCFVIFEGGGAKGITHLGALKALEDVRLARIGAAGTSAGAIIAVLTAVGFTADDLFDPSGNTTNILQTLGKTPVDLLGRDDWGVFTGFRGASHDSAFTRSWRKIRRQFLTCLLVLIPPILPLLIFRLARATGWPLLLVCAWRILEHFGFFSTSGARDILNEILCHKLGMKPNELVCFRHIDPERQPSCCALKIITTNLATGALELFDHTSPDVVVADAVAASFSIPVFFKPSRVRRVSEQGSMTEPSDLYVDGGLVSNLPVWVFFEDKKSVERLEENRNDRPIPVVAFTLQVPTTPGRPEVASKPFLRCASYLDSVVHAGIFGGQSIAQNFVTHLTVVDLPTPLTVVQFDCTSAQALEAYQSGRDAASVQLQRVFQINPFARRDGLADLLREATARSGNIRAAARRQAVQKFRASLLRPLGDRSLKVIASVNMNDDTDDDLVLDHKNPGGPTAFYVRDFTFVDVTAGTHDLRMTKYERALVWRDLASVISVPIFNNVDEWGKPPSNRTEPLGVFCLDSDSVLDLEYVDRDFLKALALQSVRFAPFMVFKKET